MNNILMILFLVLISSTSMAQDLLSKFNNKVIHSRMMDTALARSGIDPYSREAKLAKDLANDGMGTGNPKNMEPRLREYYSGSKGSRSSQSISKTNALREIRRAERVAKRLREKTKKENQEKVQSYVERYQGAKDRLEENFESQLDKNFYRSIGIAVGLKASFANELVKLKSLYSESRLQLRKSVTFINEWEQGSHDEFNWKNMEYHLSYSCRFKNAYGCGTLGSLFVRNLDTSNFLRKDARSVRQSLEEALDNTLFENDREIVNGVTWLQEAHASLAVLHALGLVDSPNLERAMYHWDKSQIGDVYRKSTSPSIQLASKVIEKAKLGKKLFKKASFDCQKAESPSEKLICSNYILADADSRLSTAYASMMKSLSKVESLILRKAQRNWIVDREQYTLDVCSNLKSNSQSFCLLDFYETRIQYLEGRS